MSVLSYQVDIIPYYWLLLDANIPDWNELRLCFAFQDRIYTLNVSTNSHKYSIDVHGFFLSKIEIEHVIKEH